MPDLQNSGKIGPPKEMSMEMRLLLALLPTVPILFLGPYLFGPSPEQAKKAAQPTHVSNPAAQTSTKAPAESAAAAAPAAAVNPAAKGTPQEPAAPFTL